MNELIFEVTQEADSGRLTEAIFTQADTWDQLRKEVIDAVNGYYFDRQKPERIRLHLVKDEILLAG